MELPLAERLARASTEFDEAVQEMRAKRQRVLDLLREASEDRSEDPPEPAETPQAFAHSKSTTFQGVRTSIIGLNPSSKRFS
jgi:hypothetical protein